MMNYWVIIEPCDGYGEKFEELIEHLAMNNYNFEEFTSKWTYKRAVAILEDEYDWARIVADEYGIELIER